VGDHQIFLHNTGVHIDIVLPHSLIPQDLIQQLRICESSPFTAFGWGDRGFYLETPTWAELKPRVAARAMLVKSPTVMHITDHFELGAGWAVVPVKAAQLSILLRHIRAGFRLNSQGQVQEIIGKGYTQNDRFFEATGSYHALETCNVWVNKGLRQAGIRTAIWAPHAKGIMRYFPDQEAPTPVLA
ncbi:MAG: DUF2459 domain-containing protein, partial [Bacteroidota bacterium]